MLKVLKTRMGTFFMALALAVGLTPCLYARGAQSQNPNPGAQGQTGQSQQGQQQAKTYVGQVIQAQNGQYALLTDKSAGRGYFLDNQDKAKKFNGKTVKVTGIVDAQTKTIHVEEIQPM